MHKMSWRLDLVWEITSQWVQGLAKLWPQRDRESSAGTIDCSVVGTPVPITDQSGWASLAEVVWEIIIKIQYASASIYLLWIKFTNLWDVFRLRVLSLILPLLIAWQQVVNGKVHVKVGALQLTNNQVATTSLKRSLLWSSSALVGNDFKCHK